MQDMTGTCNRSGRSRDLAVSQHRFFRTKTDRHHFWRIVNFFRPRIFVLLVHPYLAQLLPRTCTAATTLPGGGFVQHWEKSRGCFETAVASIGVPDSFRRVVKLDPRFLVQAELTIPVARHFNPQTQAT